MTSKMSSNELRLPALEIQQGARSLYTFAVDGKSLSTFATVSRIRRNDEAKIEGYQRPEVLAHISSIRKYLESKNPMIPNALVVAFDSRVRFEPSEPRNASAARSGSIVIPIDPSEQTTDLPGWIVDGQQRTAALREAQIDSFPIFITAFITDDDSEQKAQFILVNSTKPLPKSLIYELLPSTEAALPPRLEVRRFPARILEHLNWDTDSPMQGMVKTPTTPGGMIKDNSILRMLETSLTDGSLYRWRDPKTGTGDISKMLEFLKNYWTAVSQVFDHAWGLPPRKSRLMHGVGITSLGFVMDAIGDRLWDLEIPSLDHFAEDLSPLAEVCAWTSGEWNFGPNSVRAWNELQNTQKDTQLLTNYLLFQYKAKVWSTKSQALKDA